MKCKQCCQPLEEWEAGFCEGCGMKSNIGGKREGAGRPAPLGRKKTCTVRLDPQVEAFCRANEGLAILNDMCRKSKEFRAWAKTSGKAVE
jgi:hypothetical protein